MKTQNYIIEKVDIEPDVEKIYKVFSGHAYSFLLDSASKDEQLNVFSIIVFDPFLVFISKGNEATIESDGITQNIVTDPLELLRSLIKRYQWRPEYSEIPFISGCVGYLSYDTGRLIEKLPNMAEDAMNIPDILMGFYNQAIIVDHINGEVYITVTKQGAEGRTVVEMQDIINKTKTRLKEYQSTETAQYVENFASIAKKTKGVGFIANHTAQSYCSMVDTAREYIKNGDIFQVNLSQKFQAEFDGDAFSLYKKLRRKNPAPFAAYLHCDSFTILSSSPERFFNIRDRHIVTRPIKGTRPRGSNKEEDLHLKNELLRSEKDSAELTMIVDLLRNDLGRVCKIGSVEVSNLFEVETYATVFHLVSTIKGILLEKYDSIDVIKALFPGGSITGAPKIRAMEIIEELEPQKRGVYTGAIGYIGFNGDVDLNIAIRTMVIKDGKATYQVGGGIVWDSVPQLEYEETLHKGKALFEVLTED